MIEMTSHQVVLSQKIEEIGFISKNQKEENVDLSRENRPEPQISLKDQAKVLCKERINTDDDALKEDGNESKSTIADEELGLLDKDNIAPVSNVNINEKLPRKRKSPSGGTEVKDIHLSIKLSFME